MTLSRRIVKILSALLKVAMAWIMFKLGTEGFELVCILLSITLFVFGARNMIFYFTMARHMVNGKSILFLGVISLDFSIVTLSLSDRSGAFVAVYLLGAYAFSGVVDILRAREARQLEAPWKFNLATGIANIGIAIAAFVFGFYLGNLNDLTIIYASGLIYAALLDLLSAFKKTAIVYIQ